MTAQNLTILRSGKDLILFDRVEGFFVGFKLNSNEKNICWKRLVSKDKRNWIVWNEYLTLKEVNAIINELKSKIERMKLAIVII